MKKVIGLIGLALIISASTAYKQAYAHRSPPQEIIDACSDKAEGDVCSFVTPKGDTVEGTCDQLREIDTLACRPDEAPPKMDGEDRSMGPKGPPPEAIEVCFSKAVGDVCTFETPRGDGVEGSCESLSDSDVIACKPDDLTKK